MKYLELYDNFKALFPGDRDIFSRLEAENDMEEELSEIHNCFEFIVMPYISESYAEGNEEKMKMIFDFFELMAIDSDDEVCSVLQFSVLEPLATNDEKLYKNCKKYMGTETKKCLDNVSQYIMIS